VTAAMWADMVRPAAWSGLDGLQAFALAGLGLLLLGQWAFRGQRVQDFWRRRDPLWLAASAGLMLAAVLLAPTPGRPFIYFQF
ncbi:MAG: hypothetical protein R3233_10745, partial [Xanthomonadales bacterium]|nr:hypothetical protein [Xanthomonadales bacterium]